MFAGLFRDSWSLSGAAGIARSAPTFGMRASGTGWNAMPVSEISFHLTGNSRTVNQSSREDQQKKLPVESLSYGCCWTSSQGRYRSRFSFLRALVTPLTPLIHPPTKTEKHVETALRPNTQIPRQLATSTNSCAEPKNGLCTSISKDPHFRLLSEE